MAEDVEGRFENWKVSDLRGFLLARDIPVCDQAKAVLVQNCYLAVSLGLQSKKSLDEYAQGICQSKQGELLLDGVLFPISPMFLNRDFPINISGSMFE